VNEAHEEGKNRYKKEDKFKMYLIIYLNLLVICELFIIIARAISGTAYEDEKTTFEAETTIISIIEISLYIFGSLGAVFSFWYTYIYFKKFIVGE
jgi:hypothetical protein